MRKSVLSLFIILFMGNLTLTSCDNYKEEAPIKDEEPSYYRMPDPEALNDSDRAVINAMQDEYDKNGNN